VLELFRMYSGITMNYCELLWITVNYYELLWITMNFCKFIELQWIILGITMNYLHFLCLGYVLFLVFSLHFYKSFWTIIFFCWVINVPTGTSWWSSNWVLLRWFLTVKSFWITVNWCSLLSKLLWIALNYCELVKLVWITEI
jgi:hypothetical protein